MPDPLGLLVERASIAGFTRRGDISCGGATRILRTATGWMVVTLARADDVDAVPAWLELDDVPRDPWAAVADAARTRDGDELDARAALLGLPVAVLPSPLPSPRVGPPPFHELPVGAARFGPASATRAATRAAPLVVDLSSLWAGPLCSRLLRLAGARVVKVESRTRPDGARNGPPAFFALLNDGKEQRTFDFTRHDDLAALRALLVDADVVIEGSRPRALRQLGIHAEELLRAEDGPTVWLSITGHGRDGDGADRVAFGDDAAVAGGLVVWDDDGPCFCADAVADPVTGLTAAVAAMTALASGERWLVDVAMAHAARHLAGPTLPVPASLMAGQMAPASRSAAMSSHE